MRFLDIRNALIQSWIEGEFDLPWAKPGKDYDPETGEPWAAVHVLPSQPGVATLGDSGQDRHDGVFQIDLNWPLNTGDTPLLLKADEIAARFKAGARFEAPILSATLHLDFVEQVYGGYVPLCVLIRSCGVEPMRRVDNWNRVSITIYYSAWVSRAL